MKEEEEELRRKKERGSDNDWLPSGIRRRVEGELGEDARRRKEEDI